MRHECCSCSFGRVKADGQHRARFESSVESIKLLVGKNLRCFVPCWKHPTSAEALPVKQGAFLMLAAFLRHQAFYTNRGGSKSAEFGNRRETCGVLQKQVLMLGIICRAWLAKFGVSTASRVGYDIVIISLRWSCEGSRLESALAFLAFNSPGSLGLFVRAAEV